MPNVSDLVTVAEALEKSPVAVSPDRCVAVRNRNASCRKCVRACPAGALQVGGNELKLDASLCTACGACVTMCPTEALVPLQPTDAELAAQAGMALEALPGKAAFACARIASKRVADPALFAEVPCLPRVDEGIMVALAARGARDILLVDGDCSTCKYRACSAIVDATVAYANELLEAHGSEARVRRVTGFPGEFAVADDDAFGTSRRDFLSAATRGARETAIAAAKASVAKELGYAQHVPEIGERLRVTADGTLPILSMPRHDAAINALDALGGPVAERVRTRLFGSVGIDTASCNSCGMCAVFCPTGALRRNPGENASGPLRYLEFSANECVQCGLCADVCWKQALELRAEVSTGQLYDFEPVTFNLDSSKAKRRSPFG